MAEPRERETGGENGKFVLELRSRLEELDRLHLFFERLGSRVGWSGRLCMNLTLACEELITNTISYGYPDGGDHPINLSVSRSDDTVVIVLEDEGIPFNLLDVKTPEHDLSIEERAIGGLGIHFVRRLIDEVVYERTSNGNRLTLLKRIGINGG